MFKSSSSISYIFFALDDVIVMSVNTYTPVMGISTEVKYLNRSLWENKKYGAKWLLKLFPNKNWSLDGLKVLIKEIDKTGTVRTVRCRPLPNTSSNSTCVVNFFYQRFQSAKAQVFIRKHLRKSLYSIFHIFWQRLMKYLSSVLIPIIDV